MNKLDKMLARVSPPPPDPVWMVLRPPNQKDYIDMEKKGGKAHADHWKKKGFSVMETVRGNDQFDHLIEQFGAESLKIYLGKPYKDVPHISGIWAAQREARKARDHAGGGDVAST